LHPPLDAPDDPTAGKVVVPPAVLLPENSAIMYASKLVQGTGVEPPVRNSAVNVAADVFGAIAPNRVAAPVPLLTGLISDVIVHPLADSVAEVGTLAP